MKFLGVIIAVAAASTAISADEKNFAIAASMGSNGFAVLHASSVEMITMPMFN